LHSVVEQMHREQIAEHGGASGLRALDLLESALARPINLLAYGQPDVFDLAAAYGYGIVKNHPFIDGNKRTAFLAAYVFLRLNGCVLKAPQPDAVQSVLSLAEGSLDEAGFAQWLRAHSRAG
jgi:death-on-curing protein